MNKYVIFVNLDNILREKYLDSYLKEGYLLIYSDDSSLGFRLGNDNRNDEFIYIKGAIQMLKRIRAKKLIVLDISDEMSKRTGNLTTDNLFTLRIKQKMVNEIIK